MERVPHIFFSCDLSESNCCEMEREIDLKMKTVTTDHKTKVLDSVCSLVSRAVRATLYTALGVLSETETWLLLLFLLQVKEVAAAHAHEWAEMMKAHTAESLELRDQHVLQQCEQLRKLMLMTQEQQTEQLTHLHERWALHLKKHSSISVRIRLGWGCVVPQHGSSFFYL